MPLQQGPRGSSNRMKVISLAVAMITSVFVFCFSPKQLLLGREARDATTTTLKNNTSHTNEGAVCKWTVIMGDSNNRNAYARWLAMEQHFQDGRIVIPAGRGPLAYTVAGDREHRCEARWSDQEMMILIPFRNSNSSPQYSCHIVTSKFSIDQRTSLQKYVNDIHNTTYCGSELSDPFHALAKQYPSLSDAYKRPDHPNLYWFSNGFWSLQIANRSGTPYGLFCEERFSQQVQAFQQWQALGRVIWQSLFPINQHEHVNNKMLEWDYRCQKYVAQTKNIEIVDIYDKVQTEGREKVVYDYHFLPEAYDRMFVNQYLDKCCGGWENYRGVGMSP